MCDSIEWLIVDAHLQDTYVDGINVFLVRFWGKHKSKRVNGLLSLHKRLLCLRLARNLFIIGCLYKL